MYFGELKQIENFVWLKHWSFGGIKGKLVRDKSLKQRPDYQWLEFHSQIFGLYYEGCDGIMKVFKQKNDMIRFGFRKTSLAAVQ